MAGGIPANPIRPGTTISGKISWFGGPSDHSAGPTTASGASTGVPGIAVYNRATLGGYWLVQAPNGKQAVVKQTDLGPAPWTGRSIDFTYSSLPHFGYSQQNFPTNAVAKATYLGSSIPQQYQHLAPQAQGGTVSLPPLTSGSLPALSVQVPTFDQAGFDKAQRGYMIGSYLQAQPRDTTVGTSKGFKVDTGPSALGALYQKGVLSSRPPNPQDFQGTRTVQIAHQQLQQIAGTQLSLPQQLRAGTVAGGFLPKGATYIVGRKDQGRDGQTNPGGPILANGDGVVVAVKSDPNGFGPSYPIVHFTSGPYAGKTLYFGHTLATVRPGQQVKAGQVISRTGTRGIGNATVPGWFEIGFAPGGTPGAFGQQVPF